MFENVNTKDNLLNIMKDYNSSRSYVVKEIMARSLSIEQLQEIMAALGHKNIHYGNAELISYTIKNLQDSENKRIKQHEDYTTSKNHEIKDLLAWFQDKQSKKVTLARKELQKRFLYLSEKEQLRIMHSMLKSVKTDREWCYNTLRQWWRAEFQPVLIELWQQYHEERCGWVMTKFFDAKDLKPFADELSYDSNYYNLCKKLAKEEWFHIDTVKLLACCDDMKFMWLMSNSVEGLPLQDAKNMLYSHIVNFYRDAIKADDTFKYINDKIDTLSNAGCKNYLYVLRLKDVKNILTFMCRMGYADYVIDFVDMDERLHNEFWKQNESKCYENISDKFIADVFTAYIEYFLSNIPDDIMLCEQVTEQEEDYQKFPETEGVDPLLVYDAAQNNENIDYSNYEMTANDDDVPF